jgi:hypothetical protein
VEAEVDEAAAAEVVARTVTVTGTGTVTVPTGTTETAVEVGVGAGAVTVAADVAVAAIAAIVPGEVAMSTIDEAIVAETQAETEEEEEEEEGGAVAIEMVRENRASECGQEATVHPLVRLKASRMLAVVKVRLMLVRRNAPKPKQTTERNTALRAVSVLSQPHACMRRCQCRVWFA